MPYLNKPELTRRGLACKVSSSITIKNPGNNINRITVLTKYIHVMIFKILKQISFTIFLSLLIANVYPCTNLLVTKGASKDGSAFLVYTNDGEWLYRLSNKPAADHLPGDSISYRSGRNQVEGKIHQVAHTYAVIGFQMNEHQLAVGETTFTGR